MKIEIISNKLREQYSDETTIKILTQYVVEAERTFGKYISSEEIIQRLKTNIKGNFKFVDNLMNGKFGRLDGKYDIVSKKVLVSLKALDNMNFILFHELTHAITTKNTSDDKIITGFDITDETGVRKGVALNEAITDWLAVESNKLQSENYYRSSGYNVIIDQIKILSQIIGKNNLFHYFFYEPENFERFLAKYNIDFNRLDFIYKIFIEDRDDIYLLAHYEKTTNIYSYADYKFCEELLNIYANSIGEIKNISDFKRKYKILCSYETDLVNINNIVSCYFYSMVYDDIERLISYGEDKMEIEKAIVDLKFSMKKIKQAKKYQNILSYSKNEVAIQIYKNAISSEEGFNEYINFSKKNAGLLYDKFHEDGFIPDDNCFYDRDQYVVLGKFLQYHQKYEFDEISIYAIYLSNNITIYRFQTASNEVFYYTMPFHLVQKKNENTIEFCHENSNIEFSLDIENNKFEIKGSEFIGAYYTESQIESFQYKMNDERLNQAERNIYRKKYEAAMKKVINREETKNNSSEQNV